MALEERSLRNQSDGSRSCTSRDDLVDSLFSWLDPGRILQEKRLLHDSTHFIICTDMLECGDGVPTIHGLMENCVLKTLIEKQIQQRCID